MRKQWDNSCGAGIPARESTALDTVADKDKNVRATREFPARLLIGGVTISPATVLAPMSGVTDTVFRRFIKNLGGCGLIMTEFTSADGMLRDPRVRGRYLHFYEDEHPISAQLFGSDPRVLADAARMVEDLGFDLVDLNLGCPAKKVVKCNGGSGLLRDLPRIRKIFESVRAAVKIPFTVKFRAGWNDDEIVGVELARMAEDCGLSAVALTGCDAVMIGRTAPANPWIFRQIEQYVSRSEHVWGRAPSPVQAERSSAAAGKLALARSREGHDFSRAGHGASSEAALAAEGQAVGGSVPSGAKALDFSPPDGTTEVVPFPPIPTPAASSLIKHYDEPTEADRYQMIRTYFQMLLEEGMPGAEGKMKQFASWFTHGVQGGAALRKAIYDAKSGAEILGRVEAFFEAKLPTLTT